MTRSFGIGSRAVALGASPASALTAAQTLALAGMAYVYAGPWTGRPAADAVPAGSQMRITAPIRGVWETDGTYWRPLNGSLLMFNFGSSRALPVSVVNGNGLAQNFVLPQDLLIPGGMLNVPGARLWASFTGYRSALAGAPVQLGAFGAKIATSPNTASGTSIAQGSVAASLGLNAHMIGFLSIVNETTVVQSTYMPYNSTTTGVNVTDQTVTSLNLDKFVVVTVSADAIAGDAMALMSLSVWATF